jgi:hypothetical protein
VILRNEIGDPIAIYDVKTGGAKLDLARLKQLRDKVPSASNIPIIELHVIRGVAVKSRNGGSYVIATRPRDVLFYGKL